MYLKKLISKTLVVAAMLGVGNNAWAQRYVGGDISLLPWYESANRTYYDKNGATISDNLISYLKKQGWNSMRVRLFVDPVTYKNNGTNGSDYWNEGARQTLDDVKALGKRIKDAGLAFMLDIHYSDTWTDPDKHLAPRSWDSSNYESLMYSYTKDVLETLVDYGAKPDFIQVGNELNNGMLWDNLSASQATNVCYANSTGTVMNNFISYIKAGCKACRDVCPDAKIIFHVAMDYNSTLSYANWAAITWPSTLDANSVDYDIIGLSYYPYYHGPLNYLTTLLTDLKANFPTKEVQLVEVGYPHAYYPSSASYDYTGTYAATDDGQLAFTNALITALANYDNVTGLYWWFPEANEYGENNSNKYVTPSGWYNYGLWDNETGKAMQSLYQLYSFVPTIGNVDNTSGWWKAFSDYYTIEPNHKLTLKFTNYSSKTYDWNNWLAVVTTDADRGATGYSEYVVLRADNYAWQGALNTGGESSHDWYTSLTSNFNRTTFKDDMDGADVVLTVSRVGATVNLHADITTISGSTYFEDFVLNCGDGTQDIRVFLTTENGHMTNLRASDELCAVTATISSYGYASFSSTYALDFTNVTGVTPYIVTGSNDTSVTLQEVTGDMVANTGLVLKGALGTYGIPVAASSNTWYDVNSTPKNYLFAIDGSYTQLGKADNGTNYVLSVQDGKVVFAPIGDTKAPVSAGQAALWIPGSSSSRALRITFDNENTGISSINVNDNLNNEVYDLQGRRVLNTQKGLYIVNGKKVFVR